MSDADWFENDELFLRQLAAGHRWAVHVAELLTARGLHVQKTPMQVRESIEARGRFADEDDLTVGERSPCRIDVKSRALDFGDAPTSYPFQTALVDTVAGWAAKTHLPLAIVLVSQRTSQCLVVPVSTQPRWGRRRRFDQHRRIHDDFYEVDRGLLRSLGALVDWLQARERET